jgi:hypothetical protein
MCQVDQQILDALEETVKTFLDEGTMFTGYDVTLATRERLGIKLRHHTVSGDIHDLRALADAIEFGYTDPAGNDQDWGRCQQDMPGGGGKWAFVYHPMNLDPNSFIPRGATQPQAQQAQATQQPASTPTASITQQPSDSGGKNTDGSFTPDYRFRLFIPTRFLKEAGMSAGDTVYVVPDAGSNTVLLAKDTDQLQTGGLKVTTQTVERNGDLRLSSKTLKASGLADDQKFMIEKSDQSGTPVVKIAASS